MKLYELFALEIAKLIDDAVRSGKGSYTRITTDAHLDRDKWSVVELKEKPLYQLVRVMYCICLHLGPKRLKELLEKILDKIKEFEELYEYEPCEQSLKEKDEDCDEKHTNNSNILTNQMPALHV